jgi:nicotinamidase-related amidase
MTAHRLAAFETVVLVVDVQEKLLAKMPTADGLVASVGFVLDVAAVLGVPVRATEQYPKGLGPTIDAIAKRLPVPAVAKTAFSCGGAAGLFDELITMNRRTVVLTGMETHVCVAQTALDLIDAGFHVFLPLDAVASRHDADRTAAIRRLELAGATPTTVEAVAFEWVRDAAHPQFKTVSRLVIDRARN